MDSGAAPETKTPGDGSKEPKEIVIEKAEVDFDVNPTVLYNLIQQRKWKAAVEQINKDRAETWTWVYRMDKDDKTKKRWRILPIHAALLFKSDITLMKALLEAYPMGVQMTDDQGMLPIHLAFRNNTSEQIINMLLAQFPESINFKDRKGRIPTDFISAKDEGGGSMRQCLTSIVKKRDLAVTEMEQENEGLQNQLKRTTKTIEGFFKELRAMKSIAKDDEDEDVVKLLEALEKKGKKIEAPLSEVDAEVKSRKERALAKQIKSLNEQIATMQSEIENLSLNHQNGKRDRGAEKKEKNTSKNDEIKKNMGVSEEENEQLRAEHEELKTILANKDAQHQKALDELTAKINDLSKRNETGLIKAQNLESEMNVLLPEMDTISQENQTNKDRIEKFISVIIKLQPDSNKDCFDKCENIDQKVDKAVSILEGLPSYDENESEREAHAAKVDENEKLKAEVERVLSESNDHQKKMETWRQAALEQDDKNEALKEEVEGLKEENGKLKKSLEETTQSSTDVSELMEEKKLLTEKLSEALRENVLNTETVEKQSTIIDQLTKDVEEARKEAQDSLQQSAENTSNTGNKSVESILDVSQSQIEEIMKVNKSFQDGALKSAERYKMLKDLYDNTAKKLKTANELANILQGDVDVSKKKLHEAEMKYQDMKAEFENERRELIAECDEEHNQRMKDNEEARATILELEQALEAEEAARDKLMEEFETIEQSVVAMAAQHDEQDKEYADTIADITTENESLQRQIGNSEREKDELEKLLDDMKRDEINVQQKITTLDKQRSELLEAKMDLESEIHSIKRELEKEKKAQDRFNDEIEHLQDSFQIKDHQHENDKKKQTRMIQKLTDLVDELEKKLADEKAKTGTHIGQIETERSELREELTAVLDELDEKVNLIENLEEELTEEKEALATLDSELTILKAAMVRDTKWKKDERANDEKKIEELHDAIEELEHRLSEMESHYEMEIEKLENSLHEEEHERKSLSQEMKMIERDFEEETKRHEKEVESYKELVDASEHQKSELQNMIVLLERELERGTGRKTGN